MTVIETERTYKTVENATKALDKALAATGTTLDRERWLIAVAPDAEIEALAGDMKIVTVDPGREVTK